MAVVHLAQAAEVLPLHAGGLGTALGGAGLVDQPDGAQAVGVRQGRQQGRGMALEPIADGGEVPGMVAQELLQGAHRGAGAQGDRLDALARQVGQQALDVSAEMAKSLRVRAAKQESIEEAGQGRPQVRKLLFGHEGPSRSRGSFPTIFPPDFQCLLALYY